MELRYLINVFCYCELIDLKYRLALLQKEVRLILLKVKLFTK